MISLISENTYNVDLISKVKEHVRQNKLKKIIKKLRNLAENDIKEFSELKVKIFVEEEEKKPVFKIAAPVFGFQHYFEDFKKLNSKRIVNNIVDLVEENTSSTFDDNNEDIKQIDSSDFSSNE